jgi:hypothetical protein
MSDLDRAVEQFTEAVGGPIHGWEGADDKYEHEIVEALLAAGWTPPEREAETVEEPVPANLLR